MKNNISFKIIHVVAYIDISIDYNLYGIYIAFDSLDNQWVIRNNNVAFPLGIEANFAA